VPKQSDLIAETGDLGLRLGVAARRLLEAARRDLKSAARGLPRPEDLVALPRQRFDATEKRLGRALLANTRAHHTRHVRVATRLDPRRLEVRFGRARDRLEAQARRSLEALHRSASARRTRLERSSGRLQPGLILQRVERGRERTAALAGRATQAFCNGIRHRRRLLNEPAKLLASLSYQSVLDRGFALVRDGSGAMVRQAAGISPGDRLAIEFADGVVDVEAKASPQLKASAKLEHPSLPSQPERPSRDRGGSGQGSLF
jgi:exodeoxyribonuclease VII large subunit